MEIIPIKTRIFLPPKDDIFPTLRKIGKKLREKDIVVITSKIVSIGEGNCVAAGSEKEKQKLIESEADYLARFSGGKRSMFSIKGSTVVGSAGIDDSNGNGYWILWPKDPMKSAKKFWKFLRRTYGLKQLGVVITDSYCVPMRSGAMGIAIGFHGFHPVENHIDQRDIFGRKFVFSKSNIVDGIAAAAVLVMGETDERTPLAVVRGVPHVRFTGRSTAKELLMPIKQDIYYPILKPVYEHKKKN